MFPWKSLVLALALGSFLTGALAEDDGDDEEDRIPIPEIVKRIVAEDLPAVKEIVGKDPDWKTFRHPLGWSPLHATFLNKTPAVLLFLIEQKADPNAKCNGGNTLLHQVATLDKLEFVKILVEAGADVQVCNDRLETPLHWAAGSGALRTAEYLVSKGADLQAKDQKGVTPLQAARQTEMVALLKKLGAR